MWFWIYLGIAVSMFLVALSIGLHDTIIEHAFYKDVFDCRLGWKLKLEDYIWDFGLAFSLGLLWPLFLIALIVGGVTWLKK